MPNRVSRLTMKAVNGRGAALCRLAATTTRVIAVASLHPMGATASSSKRRSLTAPRRRLRSPILEEGKTSSFQPGAPPLPGRITARSTRSITITLTYCSLDGALVRCIGTLQPFTSDVDIDHTWSKELLAFLAATNKHQIRLAMAQPFRGCLPSGWASASTRTLGA